MQNFWQVFFSHDFLPGANALVAPPTLHHCTEYANTVHDFKYNSYNLIQLQIILLNSLCTLQSKDLSSNDSMKMILKSFPKYFEVGYSAHSPQNQTLHLMGFLSKWMENLSNWVECQFTCIEIWNIWFFIYDK